MPVKCNQHPWMKMYINVVKNPFFAVTGKDGKYTIKGLPPGTYTLAAVQEKLGEQTQQITVAPKDSKTADFNFKEGGGGTGSARKYHNSGCPILSRSGGWGGPGLCSCGSADTHDQFRFPYAGYPILSRSEGWGCHASAHAEKRGAPKAGAPTLCT